MWSLQDHVSGFKLVAPGQFGRIHRHRCVDVYVPPANYSIVLALVVYLTSSTGTSAIRY